MTGGSRCEAEVYLLHRDGHRLPVLIRAAPLTDEKGEIIGAVEVFSDNAARLALAHRVQDLQKKALLDSLTDLPNRRFIEMQLRSKLDEMERYGFLFIDIDHFKEINDRNGHDVGDKVLQMLARTMNNSLRPFDVLGRWGGEEFVAVTPNVDVDALSTIGNRLRSLVEKSRFTAGSRVIRVTVSIGATLSKRDDSEEELIKRADQLMYKSKAAGRNRLSI
jgi:diguanylate cyclase (GGDEF)-like protein